MQKIKYHVVALALLCIATCGWSQKITPKQQQDLLFEQALDLFRKEKYATAQQLFDKTVQGYSANSSTAANAMYYAAVCAVQLNNNDAQQRLDAFLHRYPMSGHGDMARFYIGNYYYTRNKYDKALSYYKKVNPQQVEFGHRSEFSFKQGYCHLMAGQLKEAKQLFVQQKDGSSKYTEASLYYYAHIQYADGEYDLALKSFQKLKESDKFAKIVPNYEIRLYYYLGRYDQVLQMAPNMLKDASTYKRNEVCQMVAEIYFNQSAYAEALPYYHAAAQLADANSTMPNANDAAVKKTLAPTRAACTPQDNLYQMGYCHYMLHQLDSALFYLQNKTACDDSVAQNAFYTMGDIYLQQGDKDKARSMFLQASQLKHNPSIQEEALFCYAKLSCELNKNPYNESIRSFQNYLKQYPHTTHREEVQEILASLYLTTRNYKHALMLIESITNRNITLNKAYQRILVGYGIELFNKGKIAPAASNFDKAVAVAADIKVTCDAYYLLGESYFRLGQNEKAFHALDQFLLSSTAAQSPYYTQGLYTQGYLCMQNKDYDDAATHFKSFINVGRQQSAPHQICDAYNRLGDCRFITRHYQEAITNYDYTIKSGDADADYATYQKALSYGAMGDDQNKFASLQKIFELYPQSELKSTALLEMANTYRKLENNEMAIHKYSEFLQLYPNHSQVKDALLSMGLIYYNTSNDAEALATFDKLLKQYPETDESRYALDVIKNIYRDHDSLEYYFEYISQNTQISVSN
ncbi:MAG: tetratricopeptide repeat protein, partial [Bacteroidales bacterium]|nr:tetratricopeptide repeat protein [Candidatus Colimorpha onthohippi]